MTKSNLRKIAVAISFASTAGSLGTTVVKAGPALQSLNNATNTSEFTINNTYGQSFSVDGVVGSAVTPFAAGGAATMVQNFQAGQATLTTGFSGSLSNFNVATAISSVASASAITVPIVLNTGAAGLSGITLQAASTTQTLGASISSTMFGTSTVRGSTSFTNQLINDLSAF